LKDDFADAARRRAKTGAQPEDMGCCGEKRGQIVDKTWIFDGWCLLVPKYANKALVFSNLIHKARLPPRQISTI
jgi:hypothetical protein